jgi:hypothetical protein
LTDQEPKERIGIRLAADAPTAIMAASPPRRFKVCSAQQKTGGFFLPVRHLFRRLQSAMQNHDVKSRFAPSFDIRTMQSRMTLKRKRRRKTGEKGSRLRGKGERSWSQ